MKEKDYIYPENTLDSFFHFARDDLYQDQIFSIYLSIFHNNIPIEKIDYKRKEMLISEYPKNRDFTKLQEKKVRIINAYIESSLIKNIHSQNVRDLYIHSPNIQDINKDYTIRQKLTFDEIKHENRFDTFFLKSLKFVLPKCYLENFNFLYTYYSKIELPTTKYILSEYWLSDANLSMFLAIQEERNIKHFHLTHGYTFLYEGNWDIYLSKLCDKFISYGYKNKHIENLVRAGLWRFNTSQKFKKIYKKEKILFLCYGNQITYDCEVSDMYIYSTFSEKQYFLNMKRFFNYLNKESKIKITYKEYPKNKYFNKNCSLHDVTKYCKKFTEITVGYNNINTMKKYELIIAGKFGSAFMECMILNIPIVVFYDKTCNFIKNEYLPYINALIKVGIIQTCPKKMAKHIEKIIENPLKWWEQSNVKIAKKIFLNNTISPSEVFLNFINNLK